MINYFKDMGDAIINTNLKSLLENKSFMMILLGQGISNIGDAFQFIASTTMLVKVTGSGLSAIIGIILSQLPSLLLSPFAGYLGDRFKAKYVCVIMDIVRGGIALLFIGHSSSEKLYLLLFLLSMLDIVYNPAKRKLIICVVKERELLFTNSLMMGVSGIAFLIGPILAGFAVVNLGADIAFYVNCFSYVLSAALILIVKSKNIHDYTGRVKSNKFGGVLSDIKGGIKYFFSVPEIKNLIILSTVICSTGASINIAFFPFVFDTLKITEKQWGLMISVFNGTNFLAMFLAFVLNKKINKRMDVYIIISVITISWIWFFYSITKNLNFILALQFFEGTILAFCSILIGTKLQSSINKNYMARVMSIGDVINNAGRIMGVFLAYLLLGSFAESSVFLLNSILLFSFVFYKVLKY
ncbi:MAG TPA: MFS transporter [Pseudobacteroides sp.]|uniref:MFS transporter n=1 Tax=Pseudobacteroides sp. TaxID=1968840 RepID=UPI002F937E40